MKKKQLTKEEKIDQDEKVKTKSKKRNTSNVLSHSKEKSKEGTPKKKTIYHVIADLLENVKKYELQKEKLENINKKKYENEKPVYHLWNKETNELMKQADWGTACEKRPKRQCKSLYANKGNDKNNKNKKNNKNENTCAPVYKSWLFSKDWQCRGTGQHWDVASKHLLNLPEPLNFNTITNTCIYPYQAFVTDILRDLAETGPHVKEIEHLRNIIVLQKQTELTNFQNITNLFNLKNLTRAQNPWSHYTLQFADVSQQALCFIAVYKMHQLPITNPLRLLMLLNQKTANDVMAGFLKLILSCDSFSSRAEKIRILAEDCNEEWQEQFNLVTVGTKILEIKKQKRFKKKIEKIEKTENIEKTEKSNNGEEIVLSASAPTSTKKSRQRKSKSRFSRAGKVLGKILIGAALVGLGLGGIANIQKASAHAQSQFQGQPNQFDTNISVNPSMAGMVNPSMAGMASNLNPNPNPNYVSSFGTDSSLAQGAIPIVFLDNQNLQPTVQQPTPVHLQNEPTALIIFLAQNPLQFIKDANQMETQLDQYSKELGQLELVKDTTMANGKGLVEVLHGAVEQVKTNIIIYKRLVLDTSLSKIDPTDQETKTQVDNEIAKIDRMPNKTSLSIDEVSNQDLFLSFYNQPELEFTQIGKFIMDKGLVPGLKTSIKNKKDEITNEVRQISVLAVVQKFGQDIVNEISIKTKSANLQEAQTPQKQQEAFLEAINTWKVNPDAVNELTKSVVDNVMSKKDPAWYQDKIIETINDVSTALTEQSRSNSLKNFQDSGLLWKTFQATEDLNNQTKLAEERQKLLEDKLKKGESGDTIPAELAEKWFDSLLKTMQKIWSTALAGFVIPIGLSLSLAISVPLFRFLKTILSKKKSQNKEKVKKIIKVNVKASPKKLPSYQPVKHLMYQPSYKPPSKTNKPPVKPAEKTIVKRFPKKILTHKKREKSPQKVVPKQKTKTIEKEKTKDGLVKNKVNKNLSTKLKTIKINKTPSQNKSPSKSTKRTSLKSQPLTKSELKNILMNLKLHALYQLWFAMHLEPSKRKTVKGVVDDILKMPLTSSQKVNIKKMVAKIA
jgi:hypothetical protein